MAEPDSAPPRRKRFSMLRTFVAADLLTLGNGFCGSGAVLALMQFVAEQDRRWLWFALALFPLALFFDFADGRVARWRRRSSPLGADLDSLSDVISFGVAPAALGFAVGMRAPGDVAVFLYFVACGISRLARFNVTAEALADDQGKVKYFEGTPIPTTVLLVVLIAWLVAEDRIFAHLPFGLHVLGPLVFHPLSLMYALSGSAMISTLRIPKL